MVPLVGTSGLAGPAARGAGMKAGRQLRPLACSYVELTHGFRPDNPVGMTEEWPVRPAARLFYAQEKAELERLLLAGLPSSQGWPSTCCAHRSCWAAAL